MKRWDELSEAGRRRRLSRLAAAALALYDIDVMRVDHHMSATNTIYRVTCRDGNRYALRIAAPGWRSKSDFEAEAMWLDALARDTRIPVAGVIRTAAGQAVPEVRADGFPFPLYVTLMTWLPGRVLTCCLTAGNLSKMGMLFAEMHVHGKEWVPPKSFAAGTFDRYLSRGEPETLFEEEQREAFRPEHLELLVRVRDRVNAEYDGLEPGDLRIIHCDLWHANIKIHRGVLAPFDFEDTIRGYRLHDIAMSMLDLHEEVGDRRYPPLLDAFRRGYETRLGWPGGDMEVLQAGRLLWQLNYIARFERKRLSATASRLTPVLAGLERSGRILFGSDG